MVMDQKNNRFGIGLVIGSVIGGLAAFLLSPKSGKENRDMLNKKMDDWKKMWESGELEKRVNDIFGEVSEDTVQMYATTREKVMQGIDQMKHMDGDDYAKLVQKVIDDVKKHAKVKAEQIIKLQESLIRDWPELKEEVEKEGKKLAKDVKKMNGQSKAKKSAADK